MATSIFCEDEVLLQKLIRLLFRSTEQEIHIASHGLEALIERERPDLIFTESSMPLCDGFQLANALKARLPLASLPLLFVTACALRADLEEGTRSGAAHSLLKPFNAEDVRTAVELFTTPTRRRPTGGNDEG